MFVYSVLEHMRTPLFHNSRPLSTCSKDIFYSKEVFLRVYNFAKPVCYILHSKELPVPSVPLLVPYP